jgi:hypothetical protein
VDQRLLWEQPAYVQDAAGGLPLEQQPSYDGAAAVPTEPLPWEQQQSAYAYDAEGGAALLWQQETAYAAAEGSAAGPAGTVPEALSWEAQPGVVAPTEPLPWEQQQETVYAAAEVAALPWENGAPETTAVAAPGWSAGPGEDEGAEFLGDAALLGEAGGTGGWAPAPTIAVEEEDGTEEATGGWARPVLAPAAAASLTQAATAAATATPVGTELDMTFDVPPATPPLPLADSADPYASVSRDPQEDDDEALAALADRLQAATLASAVRPAHARAGVGSGSGAGRAEPVSPAHTYAATTASLVASPYRDSSSGGNSNSGNNACPSCQHRSVARGTHRHAPIHERAQTRARACTQSDRVASPPPCAYAVAHEDEGADVGGRAPNSNLPDANFCSQCGTRLGMMAANAEVAVHTMTEAAEAAADPYAAWGGYEAYAQAYYASLYAAGWEAWSAAGLDADAFYAYQAAYVSAPVDDVTASADATADAPAAAAGDGTSYGDAPAAATEDVTAAAAHAVPVEVTAFHDPLGRRPRAIASFGLGGTVRPHSAGHLCEAVCLWMSVCVCMYVCCTFVCVQVRL